MIMRNLCGAYATHHAKHRPPHMRRIMLSMYGRICETHADAHAKHHAHTYIHTYIQSTNGSEDHHPTVSAAREPQDDAKNLTVSRPK